MCAIIKLIFQLTYTCQKIRAFSNKKRLNSVSLYAEFVARGALICLRRLLHLRNTWTLDRAPTDFNRKRDSVRLQADSRVCWLEKLLNRDKKNFSVFPRNKIYVFVSVIKCSSYIIYIALSNYFIAPFSYTVLLPTYCAWTLRFFGGVR